MQERRGVREEKGSIRPSQTSPHAPPLGKVHIPGSQVFALWCHVDMVKADRLCVWWQLPKEDAGGSPLRECPART
jgi:hypothetical protein